MSYLYLRDIEKTCLVLDNTYEVKSVDGRQFSGMNKF